MTKTAFRDQDPKLAVWAARTAVQECILDEAEQGKLLAIAKDENAFVTHLAQNALVVPLLTGAINRAMVERWVMEAVKNASNPSKSPQSN